jgi:hypothetical protein
MSGFNGVEMRLEQQLFIGHFFTGSRDQIALFKAIERFTLILNIKAGLLTKLAQKVRRLFIAPTG